ncbi:dATP/dGTP diphosphohydrolase domain-containing protein [Bradyrhizobium retamae]|uniref:dATP/dGTP diphosphohydrolase N-terminal domain-containing protein n=1 Tax=Bradyrhizobium retamae TaxID=1300035 RepID=A0A0R3MVF7_9BRAD|nr:dATP/dGTP diphosphohydrolase domain-containing protein [Bradyrhizobium retamae]KRR22175.1 hypothetical protein CQ13_30050 [Bradyrhizobium retamae]
MKLDTGKAPIARGFARYFPRAIEGVALISQFGYEKYKEWGGWKKVEDAFNRYDDAHGRHDNALQRGETHCPESHKLHLAHRAWNALATLELYLIEEEAKRGEATLTQERKDQSWADAANADRVLDEIEWRQSKFNLLHRDALARQRGENIGGSPRRETIECTTDWATWATPNDAGGDAPVDATVVPGTEGVFTSCGRCKSDRECELRGYCLA